MSEYICQSCGAECPDESNFCIKCGGKMMEKTHIETKELPFKKIDDTPKNETPTVNDKKITSEPAEPYVEPPTLFATGLPSWNLEPPGEMMRRPDKK